MPKSCIMLRNDNFSLQKNFKTQFYLLNGLSLPVRKHLKKFYRSAGVERLGTTALESLADKRLNC